jgi:hypothetical protein
MKRRVFFLLSLAFCELKAQSAFAPYARTLWLQPAAFKSEYNNPFLPSPYQIAIFQTSAQYGITDRLTLDLTFGYGKISKVSDYYPLAGIERENPSTTKQGFTDSRFGLRYKILDEMDSKYLWMPTISVRLGGIRKGDYDRRPQSLGDGASGIETNIYFAKDFNFYGFGSYGDIGYRKRENPVPDDQIYSLSLYKNIFGNFFLIGGYRGQRSLSGNAFADPAQNEPQIPVTATNTPPQNTSIENLYQQYWVSKEFPDWARKENFLNQEISILYRDSYGNFYTVYYSKTIQGLNSPLLETVGFLANFSFYL